MRDLKANEWKFFFQARTIFSSLQKVYRYPKGIIKTFASGIPDVFRVQSYCIEFTFHPKSQFVLTYNILATFTFGIINGNIAH